MRCNILLEFQTKCLSTIYAPFTLAKLARAPPIALSKVEFRILLEILKRQLFV